MARKKRTSSAIEKATLRASGLKAVDAQLDLGKGLTLLVYRAKIADTQTKLDSYNTGLATLDGLYNNLLKAEKELTTMSVGVLKGIAHEFGDDSNEYEAAGGVRASERKKPTRKPKTAKS